MNKDRENYWGVEGRNLSLSDDTTKKIQMNEEYTSCLNIIKTDCKHCRNYRGLRLYYMDTGTKE